MKLSTFFKVEIKFAEFLLSLLNHSQNLLKIRHYLSNFFYIKKC